MRRTREAAGLEIAGQAFCNAMESFGMGVVCDNAPEAKSINGYIGLYSRSLA